MKQIPVEQLISKASQLPWRLDTQGKMPFVRSDKNKIAVFPMGWMEKPKTEAEMRANAALLVHCTNHFRELLEALRGVPLHDIPHAKDCIGLHCQCFHGKVRVALASASTVEMEG